MLFIPMLPGQATWAKLLSNAECKISQSSARIFNILQESASFCNILLQESF